MKVTQDLYTTGIKLTEKSLPPCFCFPLCLYTKNKYCRVNKMHAVFQKHALMRRMQYVKSLHNLYFILVAFISTLTPNSSTSSSCKQEPYTLKHVFEQKSTGKISQLRVRKKDVDRKVQKRKISIKQKYFSNNNTRL